MLKNWQLQEAKSKLSELINEAQAHGPQVITRHGVEAAVVVSSKDYQRLTRRKGSLIEFFRSSPLVGEDLDLSRSSEPVRDIDFS